MRGAATTKKLLLLAASLLAISVNVVAESTASSAASGLLRDGVADPSHKYDAPRHPPLSDVDAEFADLDAALYPGTGSNGRRLQSETSYCSTWCMLKKSLSLTLVGLLLICISPCLIWMNEGRYVKELSRIDFCKNEAIVVENADMPKNDDVGRLVYFTGLVSVDDNVLELPSGPLNITAPLPKALLVKRTVKIYQKFQHDSNDTEEDTLGAGETTTTTYSVKEDWAFAPQPKQLQNLPNETNSRGIWDDLVAYAGTTDSTPDPPDATPPQTQALLPSLATTDKAPNALSISRAAHVGGFVITNDVIVTEPGVFQTDWMPLQKELVPEFIPEMPNLRRDPYGNLTTVEEGSPPVNGDVIIKYEYVADGFDASFIVQQVMAATDPELGVPSYPYALEKQGVTIDTCCGNMTDDLGVIWMVRRGFFSLDDMVRLAKEEQGFLTTILRILTWVFLVAGWTMVFSIFTTLLNTLPIIGTLGKIAFFIVGLILGTVCFCGVTAVSYIRFRPLLATGMLVLAGGITGLIFWGLDDAKGKLPPPSDALSFMFASDMPGMIGSLY